VKKKLVISMLFLITILITIPPTFAQEPEMWASYVVDYEQGLTKDGSPVLPERSDPNNALGPPDDIFFSLGFGGWIIVGFPYPIANRLGDDVLVIETTWGVFPLETADVYVSQDGIEWLYAGFVDNNGKTTVPIPADVAWVNYVKIVDTTDPTPFGSTADGFDLNAVGAFYALTEVYLEITTTIGGTTDPSPGLYSYSTGTTATVTAIPDPDYYFDHWELDGIDVGDAISYSVLMNENHTLHAVFIPALSVTIDPLSSTIYVGESVTFTSEVSGGTPPYVYQWYLDDKPVPGATSPTWTFTPTSEGNYYIYLKVTDAKGNTAESLTAKVTVLAVPVGGYSYPIQGHTTAKPITSYIALAALLACVFVAARRKTSKKNS